MMTTAMGKTVEEEARELGKPVRTAGDVKLGEYCVFTPPKGKEGSYLSRDVWYGRKTLREYNDARVDGQVIKINPKSIVIKDVTEGDWNYGHEYKVPKEAQATADLTAYMKREVSTFKPIEVVGTKPTAVEEVKLGSNPMPSANDLLPMAPDQGPPLPRALGIHWPWRKP